MFCTSKKEGDTITLHTSSGRLVIKVITTGHSVKLGLDVPASVRITHANASQGGTVRASKPAHKAG